MEFFRNIFGSSPEKRESDATNRDPQPEALPALPQLPEIPLGNFESEAQEKPRVVRFAQLRYGKLVQSPGGPIVAGSEHGIIGLSPDFPGGASSINVSGIFDLVGRPTNSEANINHPWEAEGGSIVCFGKMVGDKPFVVCAKVGHQSEAGEGLAGRKYSVGQILTIPAEQWSVAVIPELPGLFDGTPMTLIRNDLGNKEITTDKLDQPLPANWLSSEVEELIIRILTGERIGLQEHQVSMKDFLQRLYYALLCLPQSVARRVSFGAGFGEMKDQIRITQGSRAMAARKIGDAWKDAPGRAMDITLGVEYTQMIIEKIRGCTTSRDVLRAIETLPADLLTKVENRISGEAQGR